MTKIAQTQGVRVWLCGCVILSAICQLHVKSITEKQAR